MRMQAGVVLLLVGMSSLPAMARTCTVSHFNFVFGSDTASSMVTQSGARCQGHITGRTAVSGGSILQPPAHGTATFEGHEFAYQSRPGYTGPDAFTLAVSGTSYRRGRSGSYALDGTTNVNFSVQVVQ